MACQRSIGLGEIAFIKMLKANNPTNIRGPIVSSRPGFTMLSKPARLNSSEANPAYIRLVMMLATRKAIGNTSNWPPQAARPHGAPNASINSNTM